MMLSHIYDLFIFLLCLTHTFSLECDFCKDTFSSDVSQVLMKEFCSSANGTAVDRCCYETTNLFSLTFGNSTDEMLGLDLSNCSLKSLPVFNKTVSNSLQWLAVNNNPIKINGSIDYQDMVSLNQIVSSGNESCVKSFSDIVWMNLTNITVCSKPIDSCKYKASCPSNSNCLMNGPGAVLCFCDNDFQSYRCLKKGGFPTTQWLGSFSGITIGICIVLRLLQHKGLRKGKELKNAKLQ